ncbi:unnamed protein product [Rhizoctonia solani]|uniref:Uncharacterized protein n=3 Tax=Rhizoctonia solani TaxID=456999 RepID=A0A8H3B4L0_9AGAM|nr:Rba1 protein, putative [Rhizoctonia solani AG-3 Rhs1AP]KEP49094.1 putative Rba1 protein [Rhizoctonia solani 123E]CAE6431370.1 unnamed protein product [Rhizoctonia solani]CAE6447597.1 unnamed protein product [Rhizoctonia solani]
MASSDPRAPELEEPFRLPKTYTESLDAVTSLSMLMAGVTLLTRNMYGAWVAMFVAVSGFMNQHPLRTKDGGQSWSSIIFAFGALVTIYMPRLIIQPAVQAAKPT